MGEWGGLSAKCEEQGRGDWALATTSRNFPPDRHAFPPPPSSLAAPADGGAPYVLVQPYPKRRFGPADMPQTLHSLGFESRQLLLLEPQGGSGGGRGGGWSLRGALSTAASYLNPYSYWGTGAAGTPREEHAVVQQDAVNDASAAAAGLSAPAGEAGGTASQRGARKRALGSGAGASNIHTLGSASAGAEDGDDSNQVCEGGLRRQGVAGGQHPPPACTCAHPSAVAVPGPPPPANAVSCCSPCSALP